MRYVSVVVPYWSRVVAVPGSLKAFLFLFLPKNIIIYYNYHCQNSAKLPMCSAIKCRGYPRAVLIHRLSKCRIYSAVIDAQC